MQDAELYEAVRNTGKPPQRYLWAPRQSLHFQALAISVSFHDMELFAVCMQDAEIEDDEKVKIPEKHHKKTFGHHSGKTGLPFCTIEGMGQVSIGNRHRTTFISKHRLVREKPIRCQHLQAH